MVEKIKYKIDDKRQKWIIDNIGVDNIEFHWNTYEVTFNNREDETLYLLTFPLMIGIYIGSFHTPYVPVSFINIGFTITKTGTSITYIGNIDERN